MNNTVNYNATVSDLIGKRIVAVHGLEKGSEEIAFDLSDGSVAKMYHKIDCCESVEVEDVVGDAADLEDALVIDAREESSEYEEASESGTWTFYIIQTDKGAVTIRWLGESNGYYSEDAEFAIFSKAG